MKNTFLLLLIFFLPKVFWAQTATEKVIKEKSQVWMAFVSSTKLNQHCDFIADVGVRWNNFFDSDNMAILRGALNYRINPKVSVGGGYAHAWSAPAIPEWSAYADENRLFEQIIFNSKLGNVSAFQRFRNEQRWQEKIINDQVSKDIRFTDRIRFMTNFSIPIFKQKNWPLLLTFDEIMFQFGKEVVYNTFDQNRFFIGIKQNINPKLSYDFGYVNVYQQKYSGYHYEMTHMLRLFVYLNSNVK